MLLQLAVAWASAVVEDTEGGDQAHKKTVFVGDAIIRVTTLPFKSANNSANASVEVSHSGRARNAAETFAKIAAPRKAQLLAAVGEDMLGRMLVAELIREGVDCSALLLDSGASTPVETLMVVNTSQLAVELGAKESKAKKADEADGDGKNESKVATVGHPALSLGQLVTEGYLRNNSAALESAESIYTDASIQPAALKYLASAHGSKLFVHAGRGAEELMKLTQRNGQPVGYAMIHLRDLAHLQSHLKHNVDLTALLDGEPGTGKKKVSHHQRLVDNKEQVVEAVKALHKGLGATNIFVQCSANRVLSSFGGGELITLTEHSCTDGCVITDTGSGEAFAAGFLAALTTHQRTDDRLENAAFTMISSLKSTTSVNKALTPKMLRQLAATSFVSYKVVHDASGDDSLDGSVVAGKVEL